jgi:hypothetical protein
MMTRIPLFAIFVALLHLGSVLVAGQNRRIVGAFMSCEMACQAIQIRADGTFQRLLDGDLYNDQRTEGHWKALSSNRIKAWSKKPSDPKIFEKTDNRDDFEFQVLDPAGALVPGAIISSTAGSKTISCVTTDDGVCSLPKSEVFSITVGRYKSSPHSPRNGSSRLFRIELPYELLGPDFIDDVWVIEGNQLYFERDGKIERDYSLQRMSKKKERRIFPRINKRIRND